jgi:hypothetical protein
MVGRYARAKIVLNKSYNNDVNMRYFEAMGAGAVLLTDRTRNNGAEELFQAGEHYLTFETEAELLDRINYVLAHPGEARAIGVSARRCVEARHTYDHRASSIVAVLSTLQKRLRPEPVDYLAALFSLNMPGPGLVAAADALTAGGGVSRGRHLYRMLALTLRFMALLIDGFGRLRDWMRRVAQRS